MNTLGIDQLLGQLRSASMTAGGAPESASLPDGKNFASALKSSLDNVNSAQQQANNLAKAFELGDPNSNVQDVMLSLQKANVSFQTMVQVRNKLVTAYQEIMNMQV
ncbi:MAG: flagellar hook-basal body complex protein FliE [Sulfuricellaceae bacterium]|jgi:flagellar hook-basal body complex protein FliE